MGTKPEEKLVGKGIESEFKFSMLVHRNFTSSAAVFLLHLLLHLLLLFELFATCTVGIVAVQASPIQTDSGGSSGNAPPSVPSDVGHSQEVAEPEILLGYVGHWTKDEVSSSLKFFFFSCWFYNAHVLTSRCRVAVCYLQDIDLVNLKEDVIEIVKKYWRRRPERFLILPRPLVPEVKPTKEIQYTVGENLWVCKVKFLGTRKDLAEIPESYVPEDEFAKEYYRVTRLVGPGGLSSKWPDKIVTSHNREDFLLWFATSKLDRVRFCDCDLEVEWNKRIEHWEISEWEVLFPALHRAYPKAKMATLHSWKSGGMGKIISRFRPAASPVYSRSVAASNEIPTDVQTARERSFNRVET
ncbi:hypothetical protein EV361DRAFT_897530 [Lentinula raphanica]|nr:hypothetical protein EV361DRAFT_897530 [Lentinula raphanica]